MFHNIPNLLGGDLEDGELIRCLNIYVCRRGLGLVGRGCGGKDLMEKVWVYYIRRYIWRYNQRLM